MPCLQSQPHSIRKERFRFMKATVTTMRYLWAYLRQRKWIFLLFILFGVILCTVYRLYHLEWGPAFYTLIVMLAIGVPVCLIDCYYYCKRIKQVELLKKQAVLHIGELPRPSGVLEQATVAWAAKTGREAAKEIDRYISKIK